jgi:hypothetical protein
MEPQTTEHIPKKKSVYNKERYEPGTEEILKYRSERHKTIHEKDFSLKIKVSQGILILYFD